MDGTVMTSYVNQLRLERSLAFDMAVSLIDSYSLHVAEGDWKDVGTQEPEHAADVSRAVTYLEKRGLLIRHEQNPDWVQVSDESEDEIL